jgi:hypothetical protein
MGNNNFRFKPLIVSINLSSTFVVRAKCKECGESPNTYYWMNQPSYWYNIRSSQDMFSWYKKHIKRMTGDWYKVNKPKNFHSTKHFNFYWSEKSYNPALHQHIGINPSENIVECLACPCGVSVWMFAQRPAETRMEIKNRKARSKYPRKFESF